MEVSENTVSHALAHFDGTGVSLCGIDVFLILVEFQSSTEEISQQRFAEALDDLTLR